MHKAPTLSAALVSIVALLAACSKPVPLPDIMYIVNESGRRIAQLEYQHCEAQGDQHVKIRIEGGLASGQTHELPLLNGCVNLWAIDDRGKIVGEQRDLRMIPGTKWRIGR